MGLKSHEFVGLKNACSRPLTPCWGNSIPQCVLNYALHLLHFLHALLFKPADTKAAPLQFFVVHMLFVIAFVKPGLHGFFGHSRIGGGARPQKAT